METVLAIDPGAVSGWALLTVGPSPEPILRGIFRFTKPPKGQHDSPSALVRSLLEEAAVRCMHIDRCVIEDQYLGENPDSMKKLARNAGRWEEAARVAGLRVEYVFPSTWQSAELGMRGATSDVLRRAADAKAFGLWKLEAPEHVIDACFIGRFVAVKMDFRARRRAS